MRRTEAVKARPRFRSNRSPPRSALRRCGADELHDWNSPRNGYWQRIPTATRTTGVELVWVTPSDTVSPIANGMVLTVSLASVWKGPAAGFVAVADIDVAMRVLETVIEILLPRRRLVR